MNTASIRGLPGPMAVALWLMIAAVLGPITLKAAPAEFRLAALASPSGADVLMAVPSSEPGFEVGADVFLEIWVQTTEVNGLSSASLDLTVDPALTTILGITFSSLFTELQHGVIDNNAGLVNDLSGSHLGPCTDAVGVAPNWARVAVVELSADVEGVVPVQASGTGSPIYGTALCGVGDILPGNIVYDEILVTIGNPTIPTTSTWGAVIMGLCVLVLGSLVLSHPVGRAFSRREGA